MAKADIGSMLKAARMKKRLSQADVSEHLKLNSPQSVSDWERNYGSGVPIPTLKKLIKLYGLKTDQVFKVFLESQYKRLKDQLTAEFYSRK